MYMIIQKASRCSNALSLSQIRRLGSSFSGQIVGSNNSNWSESLSFTSPESDFNANNTFQDFGTKDSVNLSRDYINHLPVQSHYRESMAYALSFASPDSDFSSPLIAALLDERMKQQLAYSMNQGLQQNKIPLESTELLQGQDLVATIFKKQDQILHDGPLPNTLADALRLDDPRAIVVTEAQAPFRIVSVNPAWENLCGFTLNECHGQTLRCIQGPETNASAVTALMSQLLRGEEAGTVLTNYTKTGRKFQNRLRVKPLKDEFSRITHFVGVLREVMDSRDSFGNPKKSAMTLL